MSYRFINNNNNNYKIDTNNLTYTSKEFFGLINTQFDIDCEEKDINVFTPVNKLITKIEIGTEGKILDNIKIFISKIIEFIKNLWNKIKIWFTKVLTYLQYKIITIRNFANEYDKIKETPEINETITKYWQEIFKANKKYDILDVDDISYILKFAAIHNSIINNLFNEYNNGTYNGNFNYKEMISTDSIEKIKSDEVKKLVTYEATINTKITTKTKYTTLVGYSDEDTFDGWTMTLSELKKEVKGIFEDFEKNYDILKNGINKLDKNKDTTIKNLKTIENEKSSNVDSDIRNKFYTDANFLINYYNVIQKFLVVSTQQSVATDNDIINKHRELLNILKKMNKESSKNKSVNEKFTYSEQDRKILEACIALAELIK